VVEKLRTPKADFVELFVAGAGVAVDFWLTDRMSAGTVRRVVGTTTLRAREDLVRERASMIIRVTGEVTFTGSSWAASKGNRWKLEAVLTGGGEGRAYVGSPACCLVPGQLLPATAARNSGPRLATPAPRAPP
jgi:hypothetical protein